MNGEVKMPFTHKLKKKWIRYNKASLLKDQMATIYKFNSEKSVMGEYIKACPVFFKDEFIGGKTLYTATISLEKR